MTHRSAPTALIGGSGFIGTRLAGRLLEAGRPIRIIDIAPSHFYPQHWEAGDVRDRSTFTAALRGCSAIVNLAAQHKDNVRPRSLYDEVNVEGSRQVCLAAEETGIETIVFTSSVAVYGRAPTNADESCTPHPVNDYGRTKLEAEGVYQSWLARAPNRRTLVIVRPTVVFGERNRGNIYNLLRMIAANRFVMVGRGENIKSVAYVENVAAVLQSCLEAVPGLRLFNYVDKPDLTMRELVQFVRAELQQDTRPSLTVPFWLAYAGGLLFDLLTLLTRRDWAISSQRVAKFCATTRFAADRVSELPFVPPITLPEALRRTLAFEFAQAESRAGDDDTVFDSE
jgi:nucleoside-diphosphate-sugar epimerase